MKYSVIIPVYNVAPFLGACLDSVVAAAGKCRSEVECICVDDGSSDGSSEILDRYRDTAGLSFKIIRQPNAGVSAARNLGLEMSTGDWIVFVDADDVLRDSTFVDLEHLMNEAPSADLVGYGMRSIVEEWASPEWSDRSATGRTIGLADEIGDAFAGMSVCEFAYRRDLISDVRFPPLVVGEDQVFLVAALVRAHACILTEKDLYGYRFRLNSVTRTDITLARLADLLTAQTEMFGLLSASGKRINERFVRIRSHAWIEALPRQLIGRRSEPGGEETWNRWLDSMHQASSFAGFEFWQRHWAERIFRRRSSVDVRIFLLLMRFRRNRHWYAIGRLFGVWRQEGETT